MNLLFQSIKSITVPELKEKLLENPALLDVRTPAEYRGGHIKGAKNVPLQSIEKALSVVKSKNSPVFVYCHSGARSRQAVGALQKMGYENVKNIGGIASYTGKVER